MPTPPPHASLVYLRKATRRRAKRQSLEKRGTAYILRQYVPRLSRRRVSLILRLRAKHTLKETRVSDCSLTLVVKVYAIGLRRRSQNAVGIGRTFALRQSPCNVFLAVLNERHFAQGETEKVAFTMDRRLTPRGSTCPSHRQRTYPPRTDRWSCLPRW